MFDIWQFARKMSDIENTFIFRPTHHWLQDKIYRGRRTSSIATPKIHHQHLVVLTWWRRAYGCDKTEQQDTRTNNNRYTYYADNRLFGSVRWRHRPCCRHFDASMKCTWCRCAWTGWAQWHYVSTRHIAAMTNDDLLNAVSCESHQMKPKTVASHRQTSRCTHFTLWTMYI